MGRAVHLPAGGGQIRLIESCEGQQVGRYGKCLPNKDRRDGSRAPPRSIGRKCVCVGEEPPVNIDAGKKVLLKM